MEDCLHADETYCARIRGRWEIPGGGVKVPLELGLN